MIRRAFVLQIAITLFQLTASAAPNPDSSWNNLKQLTHKAILVFVDSEHNCVVGSLNIVTDNSVTVKLKEGRTVTLKKPNLLRVTLGTLASGVLFSGRSSWYDVASLGSPRILRSHPRLVVVEKSGAEHEGKLVGASEAAVVLDTQRKRLTIPKSEVATVSYIIQKPLSSSASYADDELVFLKVFDPELWPKLFGLQGSIKVRIFDSTMAEQDTPIVCNNDPWNLKQPGQDVTEH